MGFCVDVRLVTGAYRAQDARGVPEWPPHPYRLWAALVAVAGPQRTARQTEALEALAALPPPVVWASWVTSDVGTSPEYTTYVPARQIMSTRSSPKEHRRAGRRADRAALPPVPLVRFEWREGLDPEHLRCLNQLAAQVTYLGRADSFVTCHLTDRPEPLEADLAALEPHAGFAATHRLRWAAPGLLAELDETERIGAYATSRPSAPTYGYRPAAVRDVDRGPWDRLVCWRLESGRLPATQALSACSALRAAVLSVMGDDCPAQINGHEAGGAPLSTPHVAWLPLVDVNHRHASGQIVGFGVAVPEGVPVPLMPPSMSLAGRTWRLAGVDQTHRPLVALTDGRWTCPSRAWASVTPMALPWSGGVGRPSAVAQAVRRAVQVAGFPEPELVSAQQEPLMPGVEAARRYVNARGPQRHPTCHVLVQFSEPVAGPMALGPWRHLGLGMMMPV